MFPINNIEKYETNSLPMRGNLLKININRFLQIIIKTYIAAMNISKEEINAKMGPKTHII